MTPNSNKIERQAADWVAKSDHGEVPLAEQIRFEQWLSADPRHYGAYMKALAVQIHLGKLGRANPHLAPKGLLRPRIFGGRRMVLGGAIAASLVLVVTGGLIWQRTNDTDYTTPVGATRAVALPDGSTMTLNTASKASLRYSYAERGVVLSKGEALFEVAKNKSRPFNVVARDVKVSAVGTSFAVKSLERMPLEIIVREGVVEVATPSRTVRLSANSRAVIAQDGRIEIGTMSAKEIFNALLWRKGYIFFNNNTLTEAVQQFSRYSPVRIVFADRAVANRRVSGLFKVTDPGIFAKAASQALDLRLQQNGNTIQLAENTD